LLASITVSPVSTAAQGLVSASKGLSLRFPRFIRVREDKAIENASTPEFLAGLWRSQQRKGDGAFADDLVDIDLEEDLGSDDCDDEEE
jgi:DNA ligase 1